MTTTENERHPVFYGPAAPATEEITAFDLPVTGTIPPELTGRYLRNGPNPLDLDSPDPHLFIGEGMVHGVRLRDGRAEWYRNRWVRSDQVAEALGEAPRPGPRFDDQDFAANTHVIGHAGRTLALVEAGMPMYELTHELDTVGRCDFDGTLPGGFAAHSKIDPLTGELHAVAYYWGWEHVQHLVVSPDGKVVRTVDVPVEDGPMVHDFALTEKYVVLLDLPVTFDVTAAEAGVRIPYSWNDDRPARVGLMPRLGGAEDVRWSEVEPCFVFHTLNAYDAGDRVVVDLVAYDRLFVGSRLDGGTPPALERWTVDPAGTPVERVRLDDRAQEFPRMDERRASRPHRYGYTTVTEAFDVFLPRGARDLSSLKDGAFANALLKHDLSAGTRQAHTFSPGAYAGEPVFVPRHGGTDEDDGYIMTYVNNPERGAADLVILSAQDFAGPPVATVHLPARIPLGFHGNFLPDASY
ncbi:carotenoid oxygenase family protein [Sphaerisporangium sp. TRM90804]|uniref:carotenoid oxygenase family protein n=1 Tax=Sphaerisporangium sp. TRM90804 TaxID=3031113 RepID=UPI0024475A61|nr:carotenoid oxygenase family protein [Sphaerisporangium sp. TRM90804]MDH2427338.1 carotenoid oxygenase family protein [Sphaerisporangium sp. TRM90804]